ncbi:MAG: PQQ-binding-like beta-propeller repeat protein [Candidatus Bathyarchaeia archaeon]
MNVNSKIIKGNKKAILSLSLILLLAMTLMMAFAQPGLAQVGVPQPEKTVGYISVAPTLVGVGQKATVNLWVHPLPTTYDYYPYFAGFHGVTVTFVRPDGTKDTFMPVDGTGQFAAGVTEATGSVYFFYAPDMAGNWSVTFTMPAQNITDAAGTVQYLGCTSTTAYFTVQTDPVNAGLLNGYPWSQLPNENTYWSYPINSNNREWSQISGDWLGSSIYGTMDVNGPTCLRWQPYGSGPNTGHIVWSQQLTAGGIIGGDYGSLSYTTAINMPSSVIIDGKVFINIPNAGKFECINETTGEVLYTAAGSISYGIHLPGNPFAQAYLDSSVVLNNSYGAIPTPYLFGTSGTTWNYYDPLTGTLMKSIANAPVFYKLVDGTNFAYEVTTDYKHLIAWDISKVVNNNWSTGITWNITLPVPLVNRVIMPFGVSTDGSTIVVRSDPNQYWGYSAKDGTLLWNLTLTYPVSLHNQIGLYGVDDFIVFDPTATTFHCYSMITGAELWESSSFADSTWATEWTIYNAETNDYKNLYLMFPDGTMTALSLATGKELWRSEAIPSTEYTNNAVPCVSGMLMVGGNIYAYAGYSTIYQLDPIPRQAMLVCVNATTGNITWTLNGGVYPAGAANGYVIGSGINDGNLYCVGKGQTSTSVTIQNNVVAQGGTILIQGNVLDQSPAQPGTPAVSDASMSEYMDYLHMQNATLLNSPPTPIGVQATLTALDPNGNTENIGIVTTDAAGQYAISWTPPVPGLYTITATFSGTNSYWSSSAETNIDVLTAAATAAPTPTPTSVADMYFVPAIAGLFVVIIVGLAVLALLMLRKRP